MAPPERKFKRSWPQRRQEPCPRLGVQVVKLNNVVKCLIVFNTSIVAASGLINPVFAIFVVNNIIGGGVAVVGFATSIYMASFSIARLISAYYVDKVLSEGVVLSVVGALVVGLSFLLYVGALVVGLSFLLYFAASRLWHVYAFQALNGLSTALRYSPIMSLFTRYIDKDVSPSSGGFTRSQRAWGRR